MSNKSIQPTTIEGIKRLAKSIKVERKIKYILALDIASQAAGFQNFPHATRVLNSASLHSGHNIFLTASWKEGDFRGRETLTLKLSSPLEDLITSAQLRKHRAFENFYDEAPDHLVRYKFLKSQSEARQRVCAAARVLQFMDATKLRPSTGYSRAYPKRDTNKRIPAEDHSSVWYDTNTKRYLLVDEPYEPAVERLAKEREEWAKQFGFQVVKPKWAGMYAPDIGSRLYLIADKDKGIPLQPIVDALNLLPSPIIETDWNGESAPLMPFFESPGAIAKAAAKDKPKTPRKKSSPSDSVSYCPTSGNTKRNLNNRMPIEVHAQVGHLLKSVLKETQYRKGVYNRLSVIRSELESWAQREYNHDELSSEQFFNLYYRETGITLSRTLTEVDRERHIQSLAQAKKILDEHYPDSSPLRSLLKKIDAAVNSLQNWV